MYGASQIRSDEGRERGKPGRIEDDTGEGGTLTHILARLCVIGIAYISAAQAAESDREDPPKHFSSQGITVVIHSGKGPLALQAVSTDIDKPTILECKGSHGCIITFQGLMAISGIANPRLCSFIDKVEARPRCIAYSQDTIRSSLQSTDVSQGQHVVQTKALYSAAGSSIYDWEINYTMYDKGDDNGN